MAVASVMKQNDLRRTEGGPLKEKHSAIMVDTRDVSNKNRIMQFETCNARNVCMFHINSSCN